MKELYRKYFKVVEHEKIGDKVMLIRVASTVVAVVLCLFAMSFTAYAFFSHQTSSNLGRVQAAQFKTDVTVMDTAAQRELTVETTDNRTHSVTLPAGTYEITITKNIDNTASTGFCKVIFAGDSRTYYTQQLGTDGDTQVDEITFGVELSAETVVTLKSCWGTSSQRDTPDEQIADEGLYIRDGNTVHPVNAATTTTTATATTTTATAEETTTTTTVSGDTTATAEETTTTATESGDTTTTVEETTTTTTVSDDTTATVEETTTTTTVSDDTTATAEETTTTTVTGSTVIG